MTRRRWLMGCLGVTILVVSPPAEATWSIAISDTETREVAVGTVTCLNNFDLLALVPVIVVGKGSAAVQASGDFDGIRRPIIFDQLMLGTSPADILTMLEGIALWAGETLCVAISADVPSSHSLGLGPFTDAPERWPEESALISYVFVSTHRRRRLSGLGDFSKLRRLGLYR